MAKPRKKIDEVALLAMRGDGKTLKEISEGMGVSIPTLTRRLAVLKHEGFLTKYRQIQGLQLTELQARILSAIDIDHMEKASLVEIANALYVITKLGISIKEKESGKGKGLVDHIMALKNDE